jgi:CubicO group peptidase (beta-lactamase class C family)
MSLRSESDALLQKAAARGDVPGVVAVATDRDGTIYEGAFGERVLGGGAAMTPDTVGWIASMTKALTGTAAMQLVEQGRLDLDRPAAEWAPELGAARVLEGFDAAGAPSSRPPKRAITLRHLLTHTAGFAYEIWSPEIVRYQEANRVPGIISCQNSALTTPLLFDPGERWEYGINIDFAGKMVEAASGKRLGAYLREHVLEPLGMSDTAFKLRPDMRVRLAGIHQRGEDDSLAPIDLEVPQEPEFEMGGGGLYGTAPDYIRFVRMLLNGGALDGARVLKAETVTLMGENHIGAVTVPAHKSALPRSADFTFIADGRDKFGLGFLITADKVPGKRAPGSLSWGGISNTYFWIDPAQGIAGVILMQFLPFADGKALAVLDAFERGAYRLAEAVRQ